VDLLDGEAAAQLMLLSMHPNGNNGFSRLAPENNAFVSSGSENGPPPVPQTRISPPAQSPPRILIPSNMPPLSSEVLSVSSQSPRPTISGRQATPPQRHSSFSPKGSISPERQVASPNSRRSVQPDPNAPNAVFKGLSLTERTEALNSYMAARTVAYASDCKSKGYPPGAAKRYSGEALEGYVTKHAQEELIQELFKEHKKTNVGRKHNPFWRSSSKNSSRALGAKSPLITTISPSPPPGSTEETRLGVAASPTSNRLVIPGTSQSLPPEEMLKISSPLNAFRTSRKSATPEASTIPQNPTNLERARLNVSPSPSVKGAPRRSITPKTSNLIGKSNQEQIDSLSSQDKTAAFHAFGIDISVDRPGSMKYLSKAEFNKKQYAGGVTGEALHWYAKTVKGRKDKDIINAFNLPDRIYVIAKPKF
jgi:hypothetical protein